jgi:hypothetical protein
MTSSKSPGSCITVQALVRTRVETIVPFPFFTKTQLKLKITLKNIKFKTSFLKNYIFSSDFTVTTAFSAILYQ